MRKPSATWYDELSCGWCGDRAGHPAECTPPDRFYDATEAEIQVDHDVAAQDEDCAGL